jgi:hypothetical protein
MEVPKSQAAQQRLNAQTNGPKYPRYVYGAKKEWTAERWLWREHLDLNIMLVVAADDLDEADRFKAG